MNKMTIVSVLIVLLSVIFSANVWAEKKEKQLYSDEPNIQVKTKCNTEGAHCESVLDAVVYIENLSEEHYALVDTDYGDNSLRVMPFAPDPDAIDQEMSVKVVQVFLDNPGILNMDVFYQTERAQVVNNFSSNGERKFRGVGRCPILKYYHYFGEIVEHPEFQLDDDILLKNDALCIIMGKLYVISNQ